MRRAQQLGFIAAVLAVGVAVGRFSAPDVERVTGPRLGDSALVVRSASPTRDSGRKSPEHDHPRVEFITGEADDADVVDVAHSAIASACAAGQSAAHNPDDPALACAARDASDTLGELLLGDPVALAAALARFRQERDVASLEILSAGLGRVVDPAVEELALELAQRDPDPLRRAVAFDLLDRLDAPAAVPAALAAFGRESDPRVRRAALRAVPGPRGNDVAGAGPLVAELTRLLTSESDAEIRRRAAILLGEWRTRDAELAPILDALAGDSSAQVRAGCAFACELAGRRSEPVIEALVAAVEAEHEDPLVRDTAWNALGALAPLPARAHAAWAAHSERLDAAGEATN